MAIKSCLSSAWLDESEGMLFDEIPDRLASSIYGGSTSYETNQRRCVDDECLYKEKRVEDGETVHSYTGDKSPWERSFHLDLDLDLLQFG